MPAIAFTVALVAPTLTLAGIAGKPRVIDGDTLEIHGQRIQAYGIDTPESGQTCVADVERWLCGEQKA